MNGGVDIDVFIAIAQESNPGKGAIAVVGVISGKHKIYTRRTPWGTNFATLDQAIDLALEKLAGRRGLIWTNMMPTHGSGDRRGFTWRDGHLVAANLTEIRHLMNRVESRWLEAARRAAREALEAGT